MSPGPSTSPPASGCARNVRPRGEGGGAAREGAALLQGLVRCGRCGRRMQVAYSGTSGHSSALCVRPRPSPARHRQRCQSLGGGRLDKAVAAAFLEAVTPAGVAATAGAIARARGPARAAPRRPAPRARARRSSRPTARAASSTPASPSTGSSRAPSNAPSRTRSPRSSASARQARRARAAPARRRSPTTNAARSRGSRATCRELWHATTTSDRDRKELLRTLVREVVVTVDRPEAPRRGRGLLGRRRAHRAQRARSTRRGPERHRTAEDTHRADPPPRRAPPRRPDRRDPQPPRPHAPAPACRSPKPACAASASAPASPPPRHRTPTARLVTIQHAATRARRLDRHHPPLAQRRAAPRRADHARTRRGGSGSPTRSARRFVPDVPDGFVAARRRRPPLGCARQTVLHKVQRGELRRHPGHPRPPQRARHQGSRRRAWTD